MSVVSPPRADQPTTPLPRPASKPREGLLRGGRGRLSGLVLALGGLLLTVWASIFIGTYDLGLTDVVEAVTHGPSTPEATVALHVRLPRTLAGVLAGIALGIAGAVMQGLTRNPLAGPGILGVNAGAALAVVLAMTFLGVGTTSGYIWFAFGGAAVAAVFVYTLGSLGLGGATPVKLALAGAAFTALLGACTTMIVLSNASTLDDYRFWAVGSLTRADWHSLTVVAPFLLVGAVLAAGLTRSLNALALGDDLARSLGTRLWVDRSIAAVAVVLLAGGATALAGPIGFVGLVVPHIARMITGPDYRWVLAWTCLLAPTLLLAADVLGRVLVHPQQIQVGIITALAGAPFFLYLVRNRRVIGV
jgi:iron complex transport system permease protein